MPSPTPRSQPSPPLDKSPAALFERVFDRLRLSRPRPIFEVEFRPFTGLRSQIALRDGCARVRLSDLLRSAPPIVLEGLAEILLCQLYRYRASPEARECYLAWTYHSEVRRRVEALRRARARLRLLPPRGEHFDLEEIFLSLNRRFFNGELPPCRLGWSLRAAETVLGRYDPAHRAIIISRKLDAASVPRYVVEYLVFHEMLHARFPLQHRGGRRVIHSREFRVAEKAFPHYHQARGRLKHAFA